MPIFPISKSTILTGEYPFLRVPNFDEFIASKNSGNGKTLADSANLRAQALALIDDSLTWEVLEWLVQISSVPVSPQGGNSIPIQMAQVFINFQVLLKGVLRPEDAQRAIQAGVAGIIVSNLGGRSMDHAPSTVIKY
jgi:isopentenyl diphosphate isomerase/L-lactate dehydrogenase-like FMN-dependent dehydrogenase